MAAVDTGKSFANGEQLTAAKLNQMFGNSTFATGAVDNSTMTINSLGQLSVNQVTSSNIAANALNLDDIQQIDTNKFLGRTSAETGNVEQVDISAIANLLRPKFVTAGTSGSTALDNQIDSGTGNTDYVYNINEFTSTDSDFGSYKQIVAVHIDCFAQSSDALNQVYSYYPDGVQNLMCAAGAYSTADAVQSETNSVIPINSGQSTFTIRHARQSGATSADSTFSAIRGFTIIPNLPIS